MQKWCNWWGDWWIYINVAFSYIASLGAAKAIQTWRKHALHDRRSDLLISHEILGYKVFRIHLSHLADYHTPQSHRQQLPSVPNPLSASSRYEVHCILHVAPTPQVHSAQKQVPDDLILHVGLWDAQVRRKSYLIEGEVEIRGMPRVDVFKWTSGQDQRPNERTCVFRRVGEFEANAVSTRYWINTKASGA